MKRYVVFNDTCMLHIDESDHVPSMEEVEDAQRFKEAIAAGDQRVELVEWDERPGCFLAFWKEAA